MPLMNTLEVTYEQAQENLDAVLDRALEQQGVLVIHRPGKPRVTMLAEVKLRIYFICLLLIMIQHCSLFPLLQFLYLL